MKDKPDDPEFKQTKKPVQSPKSMKKEELEKILNQFVSDNKIEQAKIQKEKTKDFEALSAITSEYLNSFIIFGYGFDGQRVFISSAKTPQEYDALAEHLRLMATQLFGMTD